MVIGFSMGYPVGAMPNTLKKPGTGRSLQEESLYSSLLDVANSQFLEG